VSFGSWIAMKLLMRRPEIECFVAIVGPANRFDFSLLAPCPRSGLFIHGDLDRVAPLKEVMEQIDKLKTQNGAVIEHAVAFTRCADSPHPTRPMQHAAWRHHVTT
jgi:hypothetical protein